MSREKAFLKSRIVLCCAAFMMALTTVPTIRAARAADFNEMDIESIWKELWKSGATGEEPRLQNLSTNDVIKMAGEWTVTFGVTPDRVSILLRTNQTVEVSGRKDGKDWKKTGEWRVSSTKLVLFLEKDSLPGFVFRTRQHYYIFDPWARRMMSELQRQKKHN